MLRLEDIQKNAIVTGLDPSGPARIVSVETLGPDARTVYYKTAEGQIRERLVFRSDEASLFLAQAGQTWAFDAPGAEFKLAIEALRMHWAHLFDPMMAVYTSNVEPLPHQITAVYDAMLPRQPLRFVLADDPGAGKTIMTGLYLRELMLRGDAERVLIVAPGSLTTQWQDEMLEKFGLEFSLLSRETIENTPTNPFETFDLLIARLDQLARSDTLREQLRASHWDVIVVDEAHKLAASYYGNEIKKTKRFQLGELLGAICRHFLLLTATPHNGKEADFQLFLSLLDADRFYGKFREGVHQVEVSDLMRRMVKEDLVRFDGTPLFPERRAYTVTYPLSEAEAALYAAVTSYVREQFDRAEKLQDRSRKGTVGFALTTLQRRLASSPMAIHQSLRRRRERLQRRLEETKLLQRGMEQLAASARQPLADPYHAEDLWEDEEALTAEEYEALEERLVDEATASETLQELAKEIAELERLEAQARALVHSGQDRKWSELSRLLHETPELRAVAAHRRKLIVFTEHRDTLEYLAQRIGTLLGRPEAVLTLHGGLPRETRRQIQERFRFDPLVRVLVATDAAGEGINLQNANLMVNYDLPWNPNRLEQRFGRIHRIGQTEVCHLWNLVAAETREGDVFQHLLRKLDEMRQALGGRVFDILGEVFAETSLKDLLIEAIRYGEDPAVRARLWRQVEGALDRAHIERIVQRHALAREVMDEARLSAICEAMEKAEARRLHPYYVRSFFLEAFALVGGVARAREPGRYEIRHVPALLRERDRRLSGRDPRYRQPVLPRYERVCFEKNHVRLSHRPAAPMATLLHPAHPLMQALTDVMLEHFRGHLAQGALFVDPHDTGTTPRVLFLLDHAIKEGAEPERVASRRLQFVAITPDGQTMDAGWAPHLDLEPLADADRALLGDILSSPWLERSLEERALAHALTHLVPEHYEEVRTRREAIVDKTLQAVHERLTREINFWSDRYLKLKEDLAAGKDVRLSLENVRRTIDELTARFQRRTRELQQQRQLVSGTPVLLSVALVIPAGLLHQRRGLDLAAETNEVDAAARSRIERLAMQAVIDAEMALGHTVIDVSAQKCGWDITSLPPAREGRLPQARHIEVKGRAKGQTTITVTRNEVLTALNQGEKYYLAIVIVDGETYEGPFYVPQPFVREPQWEEVSINLDLEKLLARAVPAAATQPAEAPQV